MTYNTHVFVYIYLYIYVCMCMDAFICIYVYILLINFELNAIFQETIQFNRNRLEKVKVKIHLLSLTHTVGKKHLEFKIPTHTCLGSGVFCREVFSI